MNFIVKICLNATITLLFIIPFISAELICEENMLLCGDRLHCIQSFQLCDYSVDCKDGSDEANFELCKNLVTHKENCPPDHSHILLKCKSEESDYSAYYDEDSGDYKSDDQFSFLYDKCLDIVTACKLGNKCLSSSDISICDQITDNKLKSDSRFVEKSSAVSNETENDDESLEYLIKYIGHSVNLTLGVNFTFCPPLFFFNNGICSHFFIPAKLTWSEAKLFCELIGGKLAIIDELDKYEKLLNILHSFTSSESKYNFWIGGYLKSDLQNETIHSTGTYIWTNGKAVQKGAPFWSLSFEDISSENKSCSNHPKSLMPIYNTGERCIALLHTNSLYFSDEDCNNKYSPLCVADPYK